MKKARHDLRKETRIKTVDGMIAVGGQLFKTKLDVRVTSDSKGQTMSITDNNLGAMFVIPIEPVSDYVSAWGSFSELPEKEKARVDEITACIAELMNAPTIEVPRWIPVTERLPKASKSVFVTYIFDGKARVDIDNCIDGLCWMKHRNVTHWMPLPDAPKDGDT